MGHEVAVGEVGHSEVAHQSHYRHDEDGGDIGEANGEQLFAAERLCGEHHERDSYQGKFLLHVEETVAEVLGANEPNQVHRPQDKKCLEQMVLFEVGELLPPVPFNNPVGQQQHPQQVGEKHRCGHTDSQQKDEGYVDCSMNTGTDGSRDWYLTIGLLYRLKSRRYSSELERISTAFFTSGSLRRELSMHPLR